MTQARSSKGASATSFPISRGIVQAVIQTADIQDRGGAPLVPVEIIRRLRWIRQVFAEGGYAGEKLKCALHRFCK